MTFPGTEIIVEHKIKHRKHINYILDNRNVYLKAVRFGADVGEMRFVVQRPFNGKVGDRCCSIAGSFRDLPVHDNGKSTSNLHQSDRIDFGK